MFESCTAPVLDTNGFALWGQCFSEVVWGDPTLIVILMIAILAYIAYKFNFPMEFSLVLGVGMVFMMGIAFSGSAIYSLVALVVIALSVVLLKGLVKPGKP